MSTERKVATDLERHWRAGQKRVVEFGEWLYEKVLKHVPHRQWVKIISFIEDSEIIKKILKHLNLWDVKRKPPPRANDPPTESFIVYDVSSSPSADEPPSLLWLRRDKLQN